MLPSSSLTSHRIFELSVAYVSNHTMLSNYQPPNPPPPPPIGAPPIGEPPIGAPPPIIPPIAVTGKGKVHGC